MTRRSTRILWLLIGICLAIGGAASLSIWLGPVDKASRPVIRELAAISDIMAFLFWMLVFAIYWANRRDDP